MRRREAPAGPSCFRRWSLAPGHCRLASARLDRGQVDAPPTTSGVAPACLSTLHLSSSAAWRPSEQTRQFLPDYRTRSAGATAARGVMPAWPSFPRMSPATQRAFRPRLPPGVTATSRTLFCVRGPCRPVCIIAETWRKHAQRLSHRPLFQPNAMPLSRERRRTMPRIKVEAAAPLGRLQRPVIVLKDGTGSSHQPFSGQANTVAGGQANPASARRAFRLGVASRLKGAPQ